MKQQREVLELEEETAQKVAARSFAQGYLSDLVPSVFSNLTNSGYFYDPVERGKFKICKERENVIVQSDFPG